MDINKILTDLQNVKAYNVSAEKEYAGRLKDVPVGADVKAIIAKYSEGSAKETTVIIPGDSVVVEIDETIPLANAHIDRLTDMVARKVGHPALCKAYVVIAVDALGTGVIIKNVGKGFERFLCPQRGAVIPNIVVQRDIV